MTDDAIARALTIADTLCSEAIADEHSCTWLRFQRIDGQATLRAIGPNLANGTAGVAVFLARAFSESAEPRHAVIAHKAVTAALRTYRLLGQQAVLPVGFYSGAAGILWGLRLVCELTAKPFPTGWERVEEQLLRSISSCSDVTLDTGLAGAFTSSPDRPGRPGAPVEASGKLRSILARGPTLTDGWVTGAGGALWAATLREEGRESILPATRIWLDRTRNETSRGIGWCDGEAGVLLARTHLQRLTGDPETRAVTRSRIKALTDRVRQEPGEQTPTIAAGTLGVAEVLWLVRSSGHSGPPRLMREVCNAASTAADPSAIMPVWKPRVPEDAGLLRGVSGIGYSLLRCAIPKRVPTLLVPPIMGH